MKGLVTFMSKIVFFCIPAHGHTNPTLNVVKELISRGHQVWYYSYESFREKIESNPSEPTYIHTKWGVGYFFQN